MARAIADHFSRTTHPSALAAFPNIDGVVALTHKTGCGMTQDEPLRLLRRTLWANAILSAASGAGLALFAGPVARLAAALAYLMLQQRDSVGLVTFDTKIRRYIPPRSSVPHLRVLLDELQSAQPGGETALGGVFRELVPRIQRRGLLIVLSDCFGEVKELVKALAQFRHARHEILIFQILDRDELEFPFTHWTRFESLETAGAHRMIDPAQFRAAYLDNLKKFQDELTQGCHRHRIDLVPMVTDQPYAEALAQYLTRRLARG